MADNHFLLRDPSQEPWTHRDSEGEIQYVLKEEEQILQSISGRAPLPEILRKICHALDLEIGKMISLFSLPHDDTISLPAIVRSAGVFGLYKFCSAQVAGENDELLGSLEMYSCLPRRPFLPEVRLIERATCLAAVAIKRHNDSKA